MRMASVTRMVSASSFRHGEQHFALTGLRVANGPEREQVKRRRESCGRQREPPVVRGDGLGHDSVQERRTPHASKQRADERDIGMAAACDSPRPVDDRLVVAVNLDEWLLTRESCSRAGELVSGRLG
jgi:hypothetical protein